MFLASVSTGSLLGVAKVQSGRVRGLGIEEKPTMTTWTAALPLASLVQAKVP